MSRTQFLTIALALVVSSTSVAAETPANPVAATEASPAPSQPEAMPASPAAPVAEAPAAQKKSIVLGPEGVDDEGRVGRLHTVTRGDTLWDVSAAYLGTPWVWPSVWIDNHDIANPHMIHPGDRIWITANEMRVVSDDEADAFLERLLEAPAAPETDMAAEEMVEEPAPQTVGDRARRVRPGRRARTESCRSPDHGQRACGDGLRFRRTIGRCLEHHRQPERTNLRDGRR